MGLMQVQFDAGSGVGCSNCLHACGQPHVTRAPVVWVPCEVDEVGAGATNEASKCCPRRALVHAQRQDVGSVSH